MKLRLAQDYPGFACGACGTCCSHIRGWIPKEEKEFIKEHAFGKLPVIQIMPIEQMTFPLWDWEAKRFRNWQTQANVDAKIEPLRVIFDLKSGKTIVLTYSMNPETGACPFLRNNKCSIYHTRRAYVCRLFPFNKSPFSDRNEKKENLFGNCGAMEKILPAIPDEFGEMVKFLNNAFPDGSFLDAVQNDLIAEWANRIVVDLIRKNTIKPAVNYPYRFLVKRVRNSQKTDFTDFLTESGYFGRKEMENLINRFDINADAREKLSDFN